MSFYGEKNTFELKKTSVSSLEGRRNRGLLGWKKTSGYTLDRRKSWRLLQTERDLTVFFLGRKRPLFLFGLLWEKGYFLNECQCVFFLDRKRLMALIGLL